jgi:hypothetical protein
VGEPEHIDEEMSSTTQESNVQAVLHEVGITPVVPLSYRASSPHELIEIQAGISVEPCSKSIRELPRGRNYEKVLHRIVRKIRRKGESNKKIMKDKNQRHCRKRKFRSIVNSKIVLKFRNSATVPGTRKTVTHIARKSQIREGP